MTDSRQDFAADALARRRLQKMRENAWNRGETMRSGPRKTKKADGEDNSVAPWDQAKLRAQEMRSEVERAPGMPGGKGRARASKWDPRTSKIELDAFIRKMGWGRQLQIASVVSRWPELVGPGVAEHCQVETFREGKLVLRASSTAWAQQIRLMLPNIEAMLEREIGAGVVEEIKILGPTGPSWKHGKRTVRGGRGPRDTYG